VGYLPVILILAFGAIGFWIAGVPGGLAGLLAGYVGLVVLGNLSIKMGGGMLPRKLRQEVAASFALAHDEIIALAFPEYDERSRLRKVEQLLDGIFERAARDNTSMNQDMAVARGAIRAATGKLASEEKSLPRRELLRALEVHIEAEIYP
jgi:hypothetical protein